MSETTTTIHQHGPAYLKAFIALGILTAIEIAVGSLETDAFVLILLVVLAVAKVIIIAAIFMHVAYEKDTGQIIFLAFLLPLIGVILLTVTITLDYRGY